MATEMIQLYYTMLRSPSFNSTCLIQCISYTVVNCIYKYYTMLLSPSFNSTCLIQCISYTVVNCIYKIIKCCIPTLHHTALGRMSACVLRDLWCYDNSPLSRSPSVCLSVCLSISPTSISLLQYSLLCVSLSLLH